MWPPCRGAMWDRRAAVAVSPSPACRRVRSPTLPAIPAVVCGRPTTPASPGATSPMAGSRPAPSARLPLPRPTRTCCTWAWANTPFVDSRPRMAMASTRAPTWGARGRTPDSRPRDRLRRCACIRRTPMSCMWPRRVIAGRAPRIAACIARMTVGPRGRRCWPGRTPRAVRTISPWIPPTRAFCTRPSGTTSVSPGTCAAVAVAAASGRAPTAVTPGRVSRRGCPRSWARSVSRCLRPTPIDCTRLWRRSRVGCIAAMMRGVRGVACPLTASFRRAPGTT